jgi:glycosyltransferase involved in cell wall biosynthesis
MKVAFVIPTYNSAVNLPALLDSFKKQTFHDFEIIIVDDPRTTDETKEVIRAYADSLSLKYLKAPKEGPSVARNLGILSTDAEIICFVDSDCVLEEHCVEEFVKHWTKVDSKVGAIRGKVLPKTTDFFTNILSRGLYISELHKGATDNISYRREVLVLAGLFDEKLHVNEDADLSMRVQKLGFRIEYNDKAIVFHDYRFNMTRFIKREIKFGRGFFLLWRKSKDIRTLAPIIFGILGLIFLSLSMVVSPYMFFFVLASLLVLAVFHYQQYFTHFLKHMSLFYLPLLVFVYILKNLCNTFGFLIQLCALLRNKQ